MTPPIDTNSTADDDDEPTKPIGVCSVAGADHYKTRTNESGMPMRGDCPVCQADLTIREMPAPSSHDTPDQPRVLHNVVLCCRCGRIYAPSHKSFYSATAQLYPEWICDQFAEDWLTYSASDPCHCGCPYFVRTRLQHTDDEDPKWYADDE